MNYNQLLTDVDAWMARDDIAADASFASMLVLAEAEIARDVRTVAQETRTDLQFTGQSAELPTNFLQMRHAYIGSYTNGKLEYKTPEVFFEEDLSTGQRVGFYTYEGSGTLDGSTSGVNMLLSPNVATPSSPINVAILYWARFPALDAVTNTTNWLVTNHYDLYLWQLLKQAAIWVQDDEAEIKFHGHYERTKERVNLTENRKRYRGNQYQAYGHPRTVV